MKNDQDLVSLIMVGAVVLLIMGGLQLLLPLLVIGGITYHFTKQQKFKVINPNKTTSMNNFDIESLKKKMTHGFGAIILVVIAVVLLINMVVIIPPGQTGVYHLFGKVSDNEVSSGFHLINPLASIQLMSIRTEQYTMSIVSGEGQKTGDDSIEALTKEGLKVGLDMTILYHLVEEKASDVYRGIGMDFEDKIIRPEVRSAIREVIAIYEAKDIYSEKREEAVEKIEAILEETIGPRGIEIETVLLRNVALPSMLMQAIEDKLTAEQEAQKYDFILEKEEKEAERKRIEAKGQKDAQTIINQSLTDRYLQYLYIQNLKDVEGAIYVPYDLPLLRGI